MMELASIHPAATRLEFAFAGLVSCIVVATVRDGRRIPSRYVVVLTVLIVAWLFGGTLVWGSPSVTKVRWASAWARRSTAWQWLCLLLVAYVGALCTASCLRWFAHARQRLGWSFGALAVVLAAAWTAVVRYPLLAAAIALTSGIAALVGISRAVAAEVASGPYAYKQILPAYLRLPALMASTVLGLGALAAAVVAVVPKG